MTIELEKLIRAIAASDRAVRQAELERAGFRDFITDEEKERAKRNRELVGDYRSKPCQFCGVFHYQERRVT